MLTNRIIPVLLLQNSGLVKTVKFKNPNYVGDPINAIRIFNEKEVDELMVLDINASKKDLEPNYELIENFSSECFMPLTYGGGIKNLEQAKRIFSLGIEKICIQDSAYNNIDFIKKLSEKFGNQSIVVALDIKKKWNGQFCLYSSRKNKIIKKSWIEFMNECISKGAGEIMINSVDRDGTLVGMDYNLIKIASENINVPLIASGGLSSLKDLRLAVDHGANAIGGGAFFVYKGRHRAVLITYPNYEELEELLKK